MGSYSPGMGKYYCVLTPIQSVVTVFLGVGLTESIVG